MPKITTMTDEGLRVDYVDNFVTFFNGGNMSKITPLYDKVLIKPMKPEEVSAGGIIIPDSAREGSIQGEVIAVGEGRINPDGSITPLKVKVGDRVIYPKNKFDATHITVEGEDLMVLREPEIVGIINLEV